MEVVIFSLRNYLVVEQHTIELDLEDFLVTPESLVSLLKHAHLKGKAFIIFVKGRVYYTAYEGKDLRVLHLTAKEK